jgi:UDP-N-acetylglucosamine:LPS N-acetylglucosamine transferase
MANAGLIICRSGYTSIMDLVKLRKRAVLVPTPGQTEQEYLAEHLQLQSVFPYIEQKNFSVAKAMERADQFEYKWPELQYDGFRAAIDELIQQ